MSPSRLSPFFFDDDVVASNVSQRMVIDKIKAVHPEVPVIIYINKSGALLERMATSGVDIVSLDWTVTVPEARKRIGATKAPPSHPTPPT